MIIEIKGTNVINKGAEMMLLTILQELRKYDPSIKFTVRAGRHMPYAFYSKLGINPKAELLSGMGDLTWIINKFPRKYLNYFGIIKQDKINILLDASGFSYSDQKPLNTALIMKKRAKVMKKHGTKYLFLPQAFGPFTDKKLCSAMRYVLENAEKIYVRDSSSLAYINTLNLRGSDVSLTPDFTSLFEGEKPPYFQEYKNRICIITNARMVEHHNTPKLYYEVLKKSISYMIAQNEAPYFLIHSREDEVVAQKVNALLANEIPIVNEDDPYFIKYLLKNAKGVLASRYHGIASALNSGTVAIGTSWSHKYKHLYNEFDFAEGLIDLDISDSDLHATLDMILVDEQRELIQQKIGKKSDELKKRSVELFAEIAEIIGLRK